MRRLLLAVMFLSFLGCSSAQAIPAQTQQGFGVIAGIVRNAESSTAVAGAQVNLVVTASMPQTAAIRPVITDSSGRFVFGNLFPGTYRLSASAQGLVTREYGQQDSNSPGTPIALASDQRLSSLILMLVPNGTISGVVRTYDGMTVMKVPVKATRSLFTAMGKVQQTVKTVTTDDRGRYRLFGLSPGRYFVSAGSEKPATGSPMDSASTGDFAVQFYPGVDTPDRAIPIDVTSGGDFNVDLKTFRQENATVRGTIIDLQTGQPPDAVHWQLLYQPANGNNTSFTPPASYNPLTGEFELRNVWLGSYLLEARSTVRDAAADAAGEAAWAVFPVARLPIVVQDGGLESVRLFQVRPAEVTGRVRTEGISEPSPLSGIITVYPIDPQSVGRIPPTAAVAADGSFKLFGMVPGEYALRFQDKAGSGFYTKNITYDTNDILNVPWRFTGAGNGSIEIVRRAGSARLTGAATNERLEPAAGARVVLLPEARFRSDLYKSAKADRSGRFTISEIVPGKYRLFAFESMQVGDEFDPEFMRAYELQGHGIQIIESTANSQDIRVVPKP